MLDMRDDADAFVLVIGEKFNRVNVSPRFCSLEFLCYGEYIFLW